MSMKQFSNALFKSHIRSGILWKRLFFFLALPICALVLPACGGDRRPPEAEDSVLTYAALNPVTTEVQRAVEIFNEGHTDVWIEIRDYSDEGGLDRLRTELALGRVPDIMEMHYLGTSPDREGKHNDTIEYGNTTTWKYNRNSTLKRPKDEHWMPYRQMAQKGYLEDLWPYIENDPKLGRDGVLMPPLKAAEVDGGLYLLFKDVRVNTLMGPESIVGNRYSWTLEELLATFDTMREGSTILRYNATKHDVFYELLCFSLEKFMDRTIGACAFDSIEFRDLVAFLECFPNESDFELPEKVAEERMERVRTRKQMLEVTQLAWPENMLCRDGFWGERTAFPGYPTTDGSSGNSFYPMGNILSMSSTCQNKEAAWEYIRSLIKPRRSKSALGAVVNEGFVSIPVNLHDFEIFMWGQISYHPKFFREWNRKWSRPTESTELMDKWIPFDYGPEIYPLAILTEEDGERFRALIDNTTQLYWPDDDLSNIVWEALGPYFAGDKPLDDTLRLLDNRVSLYLNEQK